MIDILETEGAIVTIGAMGSQKNIAVKITEKNSDYAIPLTDNQGTPYKEIKAYPSVFLDPNLTVLSAIFSRNSIRGMDDR